MLLFNVTVIIEENSAADFLAWMKQSHIPQLMDTDCFVSHRFLQIKDSPNEGLSYCVQFIAENEASHQRFLDLHEQAFIAEMYNRYPKKLVTFSTLMEFVG
ncbi:DUF4286 family protein [Nubsella zeaxanthinifaciens]|uniref:DUF4286 family protein n=1 Tax=Nubsella zeaxanthinifaciens TaxID=392412 RepID=UPI003D069441